MFLEKLYQSNLIPKENYFNNYIKKYDVYYDNILILYYITYINIYNIFSDIS